jgi:hypothetical protein
VTRGRRKMRCRISRNIENGKVSTMIIILQPYQVNVQSIQLCGLHDNSNNHSFFNRDLVALVSTQ